jgi:hypothetical protein
VIKPANYLRLPSLLHSRLGINVQAGKQFVCKPCALVISSISARQMMASSRDKPRL